MAKRNWGKIVTRTLGGVAAVGVLGFWGLANLAQEQQEADTAKVSADMKELAAKPVKLITPGPECIASAGKETCLRVYQAAIRNAGMANLAQGIYEMGHYGSNMKAAFRTCAQHHGWSSCKMDVYGDTHIQTMPQIAVPAHTSDYAKAQFVWVRPGYLTTTAVVATDGKTHHLTLQ